MAKIFKVSKTNFNFTPHRVKGGKVRETILETHFWLKTMHTVFLVLHRIL